VLMGDRKWCDDVVKTSIVGMRIRMRLLAWGFVGVGWNLLLLVLLLVLGVMMGRV
jgi:hypothetical protein